MSDLMTLPSIATAIDRHHAAAQAAARTAIEHAIACGQLLLQAKTQVAHGGWLPWLKAHTRVSERQSQRYMQVAQGALTGKYDAASDLTIEGAIAISAQKSDGDMVSPPKEPSNRYGKGISFERALARHLEDIEARMPLGPSLDTLAHIIGKKAHADGKQILAEWLAEWLKKNYPSEQWTLS